jgi:hypothetical protein
MEFWRTGIIASTVANVAPNRRQGAKLLTPKDFMPDMDAGQKINTKALRADIREAFAGRIIDTKKEE